MQALPNRLTIGEMATRSGVRTSTLRYYEARGLISSERSAGGQRRYARETLRRVAVIRAAQILGLTLDEIRRALDELPEARTPDRQTGSDFPRPGAVRWTGASLSSRRCGTDCPAASDAAVSRLKTAVSSILAIEPPVPVPVPTTYSVKHRTLNRGTPPRGNLPLVNVKFR